MRLRSELSAPPVDEAQLTTVREQILRIEGLLESRESATEAIAAFNEATGHRYEARAFLYYDASRSLDDFALEASRPPARVVPDITRDELVEIVRRVLLHDEDSDYYLGLFEANVPHPAASDLIYWPPPELLDATPEMIVDAALRYRPIAPQ